jgi:hypothetical protein
MTTQPSALQRIKSYENALQPLNRGGVDRLKRNWEFLNASAYNQFTVGGTGVAIVLSSAIAGAIVGAKVGGEAGKFVASETGAQTGKKIGIALGFTAGSGFGLYLYINKTERSTPYINWIAELKDVFLNEEFKKQHENDDILKNFVCPITQDFMIMPTRLQTGHLFDMLALEEIKPDDKGRIKCPFTRELVALDSITVDRERGLLIHKRIQHLIEIDMQNCQGSLDTLKALQYRKDKNAEIVKDFYDKVLRLIEDRRAAGVTTFKESQNERLEFVKIFGEDHLSAIDWKADWKDILSKRWIHFYPHIPMFDSNEV